ncbi:Retrovirus-related Pol polyprotein from transposon TNT 1-94 Includes: RecName: Full=Protease [Rhizoctonia solani AG-1 IB]|uniref:Rhizoctonia solani AG1-IB WGS project CAOJ00000000 data, isolate 7/3/14, contig 24257 n=1 Tax=Thanatephorus cucumeris (strain AG1-IB / isolate 7/3/14) TaxID=1108050 RepID=M5CEV6_THACB|nr:Retrovirus-related Pol polyprotein from transposon TNT 1-94 Includes: RecName: Full=Protease [Rhizoctonia solani AG-1 IB]
MSPAAPDTKPDEETKPDVQVHYTMSNENTYLNKKTYEIPLLKDDGSNYTAWKFRQTTVLCMRKLLSIATGAEPAPVALTTEEAKDSAKVSEQVERMAKWKQRDDEAFSQITLNMEDGVMNDIVDTTSANEAWTRIVERWEGKGMQSLSFLYQQLMSTKIEEEEDLTTGFNSIKSTVSKIKTLGESISDFLLAQIIMNALPPSYAIVSTVIQTSTQQAAITSDAVCEAALREEERRRKGGGITAMFAQSSKGKSMTKKSARNDPKGKKKDLGPPCANCSKPGHTKQECWAKGGGAEGTGPRQKRQNSKQSKDNSNESQANTSKGDSAKVAVTDKSGNSSVGPKIYALTVSDKSSHNENAWLLDSGASRHMTPNRHWFYTYQTLTPPIQIRVGDGNLIPAIGVGRVHVTLYNRHGVETPAVMKSVLHVPELNANLMSVKELTQGGTDVLFRKSFGAILVGDQGNGPEIGFAKEISGQLYKVKCIVKHTDVKAYTAIVESESTNDRDDIDAGEFVAYTAGKIAHADLETWHRRLGHVSYEYVLDMFWNGSSFNLCTAISTAQPQSKVSAGFGSSL